MPLVLGLRIPCALMRTEGVLAGRYRSDEEVISKWCEIANIRVSQHYWIWSHGIGITDIPNETYPCPFSFRFDCRAVFCADYDADVDATLQLEWSAFHLIPNFHGPCPFPFPCLDTWRPSPLALPFMRAYYAIYRSLNAAHKANAGLLVLGLLASCWAGTGAGMDRAEERPSCDPHATWTWVEVPIGPGWGSPAIIVLGYHCNQLMEVITCQALGFRLPL